MQTHKIPADRAAAPVAAFDSTGALTLLALVVAVYFGSTVLIPILLSYFVFLLLDPLAEWGERRRIPRKAAAPVLILAFVGLSGLALWGSYGTFAMLGEQLPQYSHKLKRLASSLESKAESIQKGTSTFVHQGKQDDDVQKVEVVSQGGDDGWRSFLLRGLNSAFALVATGLLISLLAFFFLLEKVYLGRRLNEVFGPDVSLGPVLRENSEMVRAFFLGNLAVGAVTAGGYYLLFSLLGLENPLTLAVFSGFINLIPIVGALLGAVLPAVQAILQFDTAGPVFVILATSIFLHFFVANVVMPKVVGSRIDVNLSAATIGFVFWGWCWGGIGLLLAIPLMALVRCYLSLSPRTAAWARVIADEPKHRAAHPRPKARNHRGEPTHGTENRSPTVLS